MRRSHLQLLSKSCRRRPEWTGELCSSCKQWRHQSFTQGIYRSTGSTPGGFGTPETLFLYDFLFLAILDRQPVISSWFSQQKVHSCTLVGHGLVEIWLFWRYPSFLVSVCLLLVYWDLLNLELGYVMLLLMSLAWLINAEESNTLNFSLSFALFQGCTCPTWHT